MTFGIRTGDFSSCVGGQEIGAKSCSLLPKTGSFLTGLQRRATRPLPEWRDIANSYTKQLQ